MASDIVKVDILANTKKAAAGLKGLLGNLAKVGAAVAGLNSLKNVVNDSIAAYNKQIQAEAKLASVLKSTGNQLGMSEKELKNYASELQNMTGIGDEVIINSQAMMATFTKIGKDVFPKATSLALDMSKAFGQDLKSSTIQLGKALQDPIQGVTALRRVGVQLTDEQTEMIAKFVDINDIASAQKVILGELETQVGGVAKAMGDTSAGAMEKFEANIGDFMEGIGGAIMEGIKPALNWANKFMSENKEKIFNIFRNLPEVVMKTFDLVKKIMKKALSWEGLSKTVIALGKGFFETFKISIQAIPGFFMATLKLLLAPIKNFGMWVGSIFEKIFAEVGNFFIGALNVLPFVDIQKIATKEIKSIGEVAGDTLGDMGSAFGELTSQVMDSLGKVGSAWVDTGKDIASMYKSEIDTYMSQMDEIMNREQEVHDMRKDLAAERLENAEELAEQMKEIEEGSQGVYTDWFAKAKELWEEYSSFVAGVVGKISSIWSQMISNRQQALDNWYHNEKKNIEGSMKNEEEKKAAIKKLDDQYDKEKRKIMREQAQQQKMMAIFSAVISGITAAMQTFAQFGYPWGLIPAGIMAGLTAGMVGAIASQPLPAFAEGGDFITSGPQPILVGDNPGGEERVRIEPLDRGSRMQILRVDGKDFIGYLQDVIDNGDLRLERAG